MASNVRRFMTPGWRRLATGAAAVVLAAGVGAVMQASPAWAAASLTVSQTTGLTDGQQITINGSGFTPSMTQIAIGQCIAEVAGPTDCNLSGGATFVNADAAGKIPSVTLKVSKVFGSFDCTARACVIAAQILPSGGTPDQVTANRTSVSISFGAAGGGGGGGGGSLPVTGPANTQIVMILAGTALLLPGIGLLILLPARRRARARA